VSGDVDARAAVLAADLRSAHRYSDIVEVLRAAGRNDWLRSISSAAVFTRFGCSAGDASSYVVHWAGREHKAGHEIDILALARAVRSQTLCAPIAFIGEAKYRDLSPGLAELRRLEHVADLLTGADHDTSAATFGRFSGTGFTEDLVAGDWRLGSGPVAVLLRVGVLVRTLLMFGHRLATARYGYP
jgi:hypothetical protein